jgi:hypothetical protein
MKLVDFLLILSFTVVKCLDFSWMYLKPYGSNVILKPLVPDSFNGTLDDFISQIRPFDCWWLSNDFKTNITSDGRKYKIDKNKCELTISNIQESDNGIYHVYLNDKTVSKAMLNYYGPPYASFGEEYKYNFLTGLGFSVVAGRLSL